MTGSGSSSGFSGGGAAPSSCEDLVIDTQLSSPKDDVVAPLSEGDILEIALDQMGAQTVVVAIYNGDIAGGLASPQIQRLRECIESGTEYEAAVLSKNEGQVRVRIRAI